MSATSAEPQSIKLIKLTKSSQHPKLNPSLRHKQALQQSSTIPFSNRQDLQKLSEVYLSKVAKLAGLILLPSVFIAPAQAASAVKNGQRVLMVEMTPALCSLQPTRARMRQCLEGYSFTISGLDLGYGERCGRGSEPRLTPLQLKVVNRIMPDTTVRSQVWHRYGTCSPLSANSYFRQIINYAGDLKLPSELTTGNSYTVSKSSFLKQMTSLNRGMSSSDIDLICQAGSRRQSILTDINICYEGNNFASCSNVVDSCGKKFIISGGQ
ncbi:ribonuclease T2 [Psychrobacter sp. 2Y5]|uniref:ribonuclease T2 n=1 Tax=unclassified Psychrobacter TaxID=196806 RepID=UPI003F478C01